MAVNIIIRTIIAIFAVGIVMLLFMPIVYTLAFNVGAWDNVSLETIVARDNLYSMFLIVPIIAIAGIVLWMYTASTRKTQDEFA